MNLFDDKKTIILSAISVLCVVVIILGAIATYDIVKQFMTPSETYGKAIIQKLPGDEKDIVLNEDESIFFAYTVKNLFFIEQEGAFNSVKTLEQLKYDPNANSYTIYINAHKYESNKLTSLIHCPVRMILNTPDGKKVTIEFTLRFTFYTDRTEMLISSKSKDYIGYINSMVQTGLNVRIIEKAVGSDSFSGAGTVQAESAHNTHTYEFNPQSLMWDFSSSEKLTHLVPSYLYTMDSSDTRNPIYGFATSNLQIIEQKHTFKNHLEYSTAKFVGMIFQAGAAAIDVLDVSGNSIWIPNFYSETIEMRGLQPGRNYIADFTFADGSTKSAIYRYGYAQSAQDDYFGFDDVLPPVSAVNYGQLYAIGATKNSKNGYQSFEEAFYLTYLEGTYSPDEAMTTPSPGDKLELDKYGFSKRRIDVGNVGGAFERTISTQYGRFDVIVNPTFFTKNGATWSFTCAVYLKQPLLTSLQSDTIAAIISAMQTQLAFTVTISY